jgi:ketopantoate hydroxymethyltransferase
VDGWFQSGRKNCRERQGGLDHVKQLEAIGCFGAELEVVPDRVAEVITKNTTMIMLGMGSGPATDAQYLFAEDVLGYTPEHKPRHAKTLWGLLEPSGQGLTTSALSQTTYEAFYVNRIRLRGPLVGGQERPLARNECFNAGY